MSNKRPKKGPRVTLTKKNIESDVGAELLRILEGITEDGELSDEEIAKLKKWLDNIPSDENMYAISFLKEMITDALQDGFIDQEERDQIHYGILRTLPKEIRESVQDEKLKVDRIKWEEEDRIYNLATERQLNYIRDLGGSCPPEATKDEASAIIDALLAKRSTVRRPTVRQMMVLRFWNRMDLINSSVDEISDWLDAWYEEDPDRLLAWELWKYENGDTGGRNRDLINIVPIGAGKTYLERIKKSSIPRKFSYKYFVLISIFLLSVILLFIFIR
jgi:hypothetical protein